MEQFDTKVQELKYRVLKEVARHAFQGDLQEAVFDIPKEIVPGNTPTMRCCVYKERAILSERVKMAMGGDRSNPNVVEVIDIACDECPVSGYDVTEACRGCIAHRCEHACRRHAIYFDEQQKAHIDKSKCVECGMCSRMCPYHAIRQNIRPCESACAAKAIRMKEDKTASIDNSKCTACGACVYQCPFGAITDKSDILGVIRMIRESGGNREYPLFAVIAPSISSQFRTARLGQVVSGLKKLGFFAVVEAALGADMVADRESAELVEKGKLTSSCCPAFVSYIEKQFPSMKPLVSGNLSPMATIARVIKNSAPGARVVFIGPCTAKKAEILRPEVRPWVDSVLTFEELQSLFDSRDIELSSLPDDVLDNASYYGRIFARSGGLTDAVREGIKEHGVTGFDYRPVVCSGISECRAALLKLSHGMDIGNFVEGMACEGGCINGAGCLTHGEKNKAEVDVYGREALEKNITDAIRLADFAAAGSGK